MTTKNVSMTLDAALFERVCEAAAAQGVSVDAFLASSVSSHVREVEREQIQRRLLAWTRGTQARLD